MGYLAPEHPLNLFCARVCVCVFSRTLWHHPGFLYLGERERLCDRIWISFTLRLQLHTVYSPKHRHKTDRCLSSQSPKETKRRARERPEEILLWWQMVSAEKLPKNNSKWIRVVVQRREKGWGENVLFILQAAMTALRFGPFRLKRFPFLNLVCGRTAGSILNLLFNNETEALHDGKITVKYVRVWCVV